MVLKQMPQMLATTSFFWCRSSSRNVKWKEVGDHHFGCLLDLLFFLLISMEFQVALHLAEAWKLLNKHGMKMLTSCYKIAEQFFTYLRKKLELLERMAEVKSSSGPDASNMEHVFLVLILSKECETYKNRRPGPKFCNIFYRWISFPLIVLPLLRNSKLLFTWRMHEVDCILNKHQTKMLTSCYKITAKFFTDPKEHLELLEGMYEVKISSKPDASSLDHVLLLFDVDLLQEM